MVTLHVRTADGREMTLEAAPGRPVMEALRDADTGVEGVCGGACSCGTCHVYVADGWRDRTGVPGEDEAEMLAAIAEVGEVREGSRLACQIEITEALDGLTLDVAPPL